MNMSTFLTLYAISVPIFFVIDMLWLGVIAKSFYRTQLAHLMGDINWPAAIIFYLIFLVGLTFFAIAPAAAKQSIGHAALLGAAFGFFTYATYDLTNLATLQGWPLPVVFVDIAWGTVLGAAVAAATVYLWQIIV